MKRLIAWGSAAALALASVSAVAAFGGFHMPKGDYNTGTVFSETSATAVSGENTQYDAAKVGGMMNTVSTGDWSTKGIVTGNAYADAHSMNIVNKDGGCSWCDFGKTETNFGMVGSTTDALAISGGNTQYDNSEVKSGFCNKVTTGYGSAKYITTGKADADAYSTNMVNVSLGGWLR